MNTMNVTVSLEDGEQEIFTIEFKNSDFMAVVDSLGELTLKSVFKNPLWTVK